MPPWLIYKYYMPLNYKGLLLGQKGHFPSLPRTVLHDKVVTSPSCWKQIGNFITDYKHI